MLRTSIVPTLFLTALHRGDVQKRPNVGLQDLLPLKCVYTFIP